MAIRKLGTVTGEVTGVDSPAQEGISATASGKDGLRPPWAVYDEAALASENEAADRE